MTIEEFEKVITEAFNETLSFVKKEYFAGSLKFPNKPTYTSQLRLAISPHHFIAELIGAKNFYEKQKIKITTRSPEHIIDVNTFFVSGGKVEKNEVPFIDISKAENFSIFGLFVAPGTDKSSTEDRLGIKLNNIGITNDISTIPLLFGPDSNLTTLSNVDFLRKKGSNIYYRHINVAFVVKKTQDVTQFRKWLRDKLNEVWNNKHVLGVNYKSQDNPNLRMAKQLLSLSEQNISERVIDKFINEHAILFAKSMNYKRAIPQVTLNWIDREENDPKQSIPDYFMELQNGLFHILDLKKGFLGRDIIKGRIGRKRFIDYVAELVAQLKEYERYFDKEANRKFALDNYGIKLSSNLSLIGIVGGYYEVDEEEVGKVLKQFDSRITIMSYHSLAWMIKNIKTPHNYV